MRNFILSIPLLIIAMWCNAVMGFVNMKSSNVASKTTLFLASKTPVEGAQFEYQELLAQLGVMRNQGIRSVDLSPEKVQELESYCSRIVKQRESPIPVATLGNHLSGTKWQLMFSTQTLIENIPSDANVMLEFIDEKVLDYILQFGKKTFGLNKLIARSSYTVDSGPPIPGLVSFVYDEIKTDVFGMKGVGVGFFGLLKGRKNYIVSAYFDEKLWIENGIDGNGAEYFNAYLAGNNDV